MTNKQLILIADPKILKIPIHENQEPIIDLKRTEIKVDHDNNLKNNKNSYKVRQSIYNKLVKAQSLLPKNMYFCVYQGYRSIKVQQEKFNERYLKIKQLNPMWDHKNIFIKTTQFVAPVTNLDGTVNIPPHSTGGAIDLYLIDNLGNILDMGIKLKDSIHDHDGNISKTNSTLISAKAKQNRTIMQRALITTGFINYPTEYWHWSFGDRYWAYLTNQQNAFYGTISLE